MNWTELIPIKRCPSLLPWTPEEMRLPNAAYRFSEFAAEGLNPHRHLSGCQCPECKDPAVATSPADNEDEPL